MTVVPSPQLELNASDLAAMAGLMMIAGGTALVMQHSAVQEAFRGLLQNPDVQKVVASIGRGLLDSLLKAVGTAALPPSAG